MKTFWYNFITFGNPTSNIGIKNDGVAWKMYKKSDPYVEYLGSDGPGLEYQREISSFWLELLPKIRRIHNEAVENGAVNFQRSPGDIFLAI